MITVFDHFFDSPQSHLDIDESLLALTEQTGISFLRFWESSSYFVVLGRSNQVEQEVVVRTCLQDNIPILRRCSGGGTVLQGPGCLNYALCLPLAYDSDLTSISNATSFIMKNQANALSCFGPIEIQGTSDLTLHNLKFSGNAQRRLRKSLLFHGTFLYNFDLNLISRYLKFPSKQPEYRLFRTHGSFLYNLNVKVEDIKIAITRKWCLKTS